MTKTPPPLRSARMVRQTLLGALILGLLAACGGEPNPAELLERARAAQAKGEFRSAWIDARNVLIQEPENAEARVLMGELQFAVGAVAETEKELRRAVELGVPPARVERLLVHSLLLQGRNEDVLDRTEDVEATGLDPAGQAQLLGLRAQAEFTLEDFAAARQSADAGLALDGTASEAVLAHAMLLLRANEPDAAAAALDAHLETQPDFASGWHLRGDIHRFRGEVDPAIAAYGKAVELRPHQLADRVKHAIALIAKGDDASFKAALGEAAELARRAPQFPGAGYVRGLVALERGEPQVARDHFLEALAKSPEHVPAKLYLAQAQLALGDRQQADSLLTAVVKALPASVDARKLLAGLRIRSGDFAEVARLLEPLARLETPERVVLEMLGTAYFGLDRGKEAIALFERATTLAPDSATAKAHMGLALLAGGETERGAATLDAAIAAVPEDPNTRAQIVTAMLRAGANDRALETARAFLAATPDSPVSQRLLAFVHQARGEVEAAKPLMLKILETDPADPSINHALATFAIAAGQLDEARARYEAVLKVLPEHERTLIALTELDSRTGRLDEARQRLEQMVARNPEHLPPRLMLAQYLLGRQQAEAAQRLLLEVKAAGQADPSWRLLVGISHMDAGQAAEAIPHFEALLQKVPDSLEGTFRLAQAYLTAGKQEQSDRALERALKIDPNHLPSLVARLRGHALAGRTDEARAQLQDLERRFPDHPEVRAQAGWLAARGEDPSQALQHLEAAWAKAPTAALAREISGIRLRTGDHDGAVAALRGWLDDHPDDTAIHSRLGVLLLELERRDEGLAALREVIRVKPNDPLALNNLAWYLVETEPAEALQLAERAHASAPDNLAIIDTLARARTANQDTAGAQRLLRDALLQAPRSVELRLSLANALAAAGETAAARAQAESVLADQPGHETALALLERLGR